MKCVFVKKDKPCGKFVTGKGELCSKCKKISNDRKFEATRQEKLKTNPTLKKEFEQRRLVNQRIRDGVDPQNYKMLPFPMPLNRKKRIETENKVQKRANASEHSRLLRSRKEATGGDGPAEEQVESPVIKGQGASGDAQVEESNLTDNSDDEIVDDDPDKDYTSPSLEEAAAFASDNQRQEEEEEETDEEAEDTKSHDFTIEEASVPAEQQVADPKPFGVQILSLYSQAASPSWLEDMAALIQDETSQTDMAAEQLAVVYFAAVEKHSDESEQIWECPERTASIFKTLEFSGILKAASVLKEERWATKQDVMRVHGEDHWKKVEKMVQDIFERRNNQKKRMGYNKKLYNEKNLYVNEFTMEAALLGAGSLLAAVDQVVKRGGVVFSNDRPPGCLSFVFNSQCHLQKSVQYFDRL